MNIESAGMLLREKIVSSTICPVMGTPMHRAAKDIFQMANAYLSDGGTFLDSGDAVNALASYAYGLGWIDAGIYMGFVSYTGDSNAFIQVECDDNIPQSLREHLEEKTGRYCHMLNLAIKCVTPAPDTESPVYTAAIKITENARGHLKTGRDYEKIYSEFSPALWHFSYGYGWLDAGVRTGILAISGDRTLFTV